MIFEEKTKFKIALVVSWVMFVVLLILSTRFGKSKSGRGVCHNGMCMYVIIQTCIITFVLYVNHTTYYVLQVTIYDMYVVILLKTMCRRLIEIMLMAKLMEIVSSIVVYVYLYIHIYYIYLSIYTLPAINS